MTMLSNTEYEINLSHDLNNIIKVIGVGGGGGNAIKFLFQNGFTGVDFIACNTDNQALKQFPDEIIKLQLGAELTKGLGAGTDWRVGEQAAIESEQAIIDVLGDPTEMVFITAGMGGGTGTGAAPEIARIAKKMGRLTVGIVTDPFRHEGSEKIRQARAGIEKLKTHCDTVLVIKNDRLEDMYGDLDLVSAYKKADAVLADAVQSIAELITRPGIINADFADVRMVLGNAGHALMGSAEASGPNRAHDAIASALTSPLLEKSDIKGAKNVLISIAYSDEKPEYAAKMSDQGKITDYIETKIRYKPNVFKHGFAIDNSLKDKIRVTIIAAKFEEHPGEMDSDVAEVEKEPVALNIPEKPKVGGGLDSLISRKTIKAPLPNQTLLFEEEDKFIRATQNMLTNGYDAQVLVETPAFKRYDVSLMSMDDMLRASPETKFDKFKLNEFYKGLFS